jgi:hypothetical protein
MRPTIKIALSIFLIFFHNKIFTQNDTLKDDKKKYIVYFSPSKATHVNGLMFNFWFKDSYDKDTKYPLINGAEIDLNLGGVLALSMVVAHSLFDTVAFEPLKTKELEEFINEPYKRINGFHVGICNMDNVNINGLSLNGSFSFKARVNGLAFSTIINANYQVNGISLSVLKNSDFACNGIQIGLFNTCRKLRGFQFGLWNKNQKRSLPLINWSFSN